MNAQCATMCAPHVDFAIHLCGCAFKECPLPIGLIALMNEYNEDRNYNLIYQ